MIGNRAKLENLNSHAPFNAGNRRIMFVNQFVYLGITLDDEMTLEPLYTNVVRQTEQKLFTLRKLRRYVSKSAAICVYKQMILPILDYAGFMLISCNIGQKLCIV